MEDKILLVDDLEEWRISLAGFLADEGFTVEAVATVSEAIQALGREPFPLAILDIRLDDADEQNTEGLKLMWTIRERFPNTQVMMITAYGTPTTVAEALRPTEEGDSLAVDFVSKDKIQELPDRIRRVLTGERSGI